MREPLTIFQTARPRMKRASPPKTCHGLSRSMLPHQPAYNGSLLVEVLRDKESTSPDPCFVLELRRPLAARSWREARESRRENTPTTRDANFLKRPPRFLVPPSNDFRDAGLDRQELLHFEKVSERNLESQLVFHLDLLMYWRPPSGKVKHWTPLYCLTPTLRRACSGLSVRSTGCFTRKRARFSEYQQPLQTHRHPLSNSPHRVSAPHLAHLKRAR